MLIGIASAWLALYWHCIAYNALHIMPQCIGMRAVAGGGCVGGGGPRVSWVERLDRRWVSQSVERAARSPAACRHTQHGGGWGRRVGGSRVAPQPNEVIRGHRVGL